MRYFGFAALLGLLGWWIFNRDSLHVRATERSSSEPRSVVASWYGAECEGKAMANGKPFDPLRYTCASWDYPLGTLLGVTYNGKTVAVVCTDRGPAKRLLKTRHLDLSRAAFAALAPLKQGLLRVTVEVL